MAAMTLTLNLYMLKPFVRKLSTWLSLRDGKSQIKGEKILTGVKPLVEVSLFSRIALLYFSLRWKFTENLSSSYPHIRWLF